MCFSSFYNHANVVVPYFTTAVLLSSHNQTERARIKSLPSLIYVIINKKIRDGKLISIVIDQKYNSSFVSLHFHPFVIFNHHWPIHRLNINYTKSFDYFTRAAKSINAQLWQRIFCLSLNFISKTIFPCLYYIWWEIKQKKKFSLPARNILVYFVLWSTKKSSFKNEAQIIIKKLLIQPKRY